MKVKKSELKSLVEGIYRFKGDYIVVGTENFTKTIHHPIPGVTRRRDGKDGLPDYLKGFENYYRTSDYFGMIYYCIKDEYKENRPEYEIEVTSQIVDIRLTEIGRKECERRFNIHKKNMEKYARLLG